jgi:hypothetical protein
MAKGARVLSHSARSGQRASRQEGQRTTAPRRVSLVEIILISLGRAATHSGEQSTRCHRRASDCAEAWRRVKVYKRGEKRQVKKGPVAMREKTASDAGGGTKTGARPACTEHVLKLTGYCSAQLCDSGRWPAPANQGADNYHLLCFARDKIRKKYASLSPRKLLWSSQCQWYAGNYQLNASTLRIFNCLRVLSICGISSMPVQLLSYASRVHMSWPYGNVRSTCSALRIAG